MSIDINSELQKVRLIFSQESSKTPRIRGIIYERNVTVNNKSTSMVFKAYVNYDASIDKYSDGYIKLKDGKILPFLVSYERGEDYTKTLKEAFLYTIIRYLRRNIKKGRPI